jgi:hypothetical protein
MAGGQRLISWLHPCSTSNVALNTRTCAHGPLMGHPNWARCDKIPVPTTSRIYKVSAPKQKSSCGSGHAHPTQGEVNGGKKEPRIQRYFFFLAFQILKLCQTLVG